MQTRRTFVQRVLTVLGALSVSGGTMFLTACGNVANDLVTAFQAILGILSAAGMVPGGALVVTALQDVMSEVKAYLNAPAADKVTLGQKLATIVAIAQAQLQVWFADLNLTGVLAATVEALVAVILGTLEGLLPTLPQPATQPALVIAAHRLARRIAYKPAATIAISKHGLSTASDTFRKAFNVTLTAKGYAKTF